MLVSAKGSFEPIPIGMHRAICTQVIDLGTQQTEWKGKKKQTRKVFIRWEFPDILMKEGDYAGKPMTMGLRATASLGDKAVLRGLLEGWRGRQFTPAELKGFNLAAIVGKPCQIMVKHDTKDGVVYANIAAIVPAKHGDPLPAPVNDCFCFDLDNFDPTLFAKLSEKMQETIKVSPEYVTATGGPTKATHHTQGPDDEFEDDIPF
jgi:hypothetical protein